MKNKKNVRDVKCFLLDMDGTFYLGDRLLDGSLDFIRAVEESGRDYLFLTNNSAHNAAYYVEKRRRMGLKRDHHTGRKDIRKTRASRKGSGGISTR